MTNQKEIENVKKLLIFEIAITLILIILVCILPTTEKEQIEKQINNSNELTVFNSTLIIDKELEKIPDEITQDFISDNGYITISDLTEIAGSYNDLTKEIKLDYNQIEWALLHEVGHYIDFKYDYSQTEEFMEVFELDSCVLDDYFQTPKEFFAQAFKMYYYGELENMQSTERYFDKISVEWEQE